MGEILTAFGIVIGILIWIGIFTKDEKYKKGSVAEGMQKASGGVLQVIEAGMRSAEGLPARIKIKNRSKYSGHYLYKFNVPDLYEVDVVLNVKAEINMSDIDFIGRKGGNDLWDQLSDAQKRQVLSFVKTFTNEVSEGGQQDHRLDYDSYKRSNNKIDLHSPVSRFNETEEYLDKEAELNLARELKDKIGSIEYNRERDLAREAARNEKLFLQFLSDYHLTEDDRLNEEGGYWLMTHKDQTGLGISQRNRDMIESLGFSKSSIRDGWYLTKLIEDAEVKSEDQRKIASMIRKRIFR